ncbi:MAG: GNAT family N-acetyltransferase [Candidatus Binatia bacterium]
MTTLRERFDLLSSTGDAGGNDQKLSPTSSVSQVKANDIATPHSRDLLRDEVDHLPRAQILVKGGKTLVLVAKADQIPHVLHEIGRTREITFRGIGEGTGGSLDLDHFDTYYDHLFLWNEETNEVVGAYRIGRTDDILKRFGKHGLYTSHLFEYKPKLLELLNPALELGRSFIRPEYQRGYSSLLLLWRGIGQYVLRNPQYRYLFGAVGISNEYQFASKQLLLAFLQHNHYKSDLAQLVRGRTRVRADLIKGWNSQVNDPGTRDVDEISTLISEIEAGDKGFPILLKRYLKLGGKLLGFSIDTHLADSLVGLILVDLVRTDPKNLELYMGEVGVARFLTHHSRRDGSQRRCSDADVVRNRQSVSHKRR